MPGEIAIALAAALIVATVVAAVIAVRTRRVVATPTERATHAALHTASLAGRHLADGFTDALRIELEEEGAGVAVTLIKPAAIDTPFAKNAKNYTPHAPKLPPPPRTAADPPRHRSACR